ncbi:MAG: hypothetical protein NVS1B7_6310 [Candidatus Saccharimonadales bacterium]
MTRYVLYVLCAFLIAISLFGLYRPTSELACFINVSHNWTYARIGTATAMLLYTAIDYFKQYFLRIVFGLIGCGLILAGLLSITSYYLMIVDTFALITGGIFTLLATLELSTKHPIRLRTAQIATGRLFTSGIDNRSAAS